MIPCRDGTCTWSDAAVAICTRALPLTSNADLPSIKPTRGQSTCVEKGDVKRASAITQAFNLLPKNTITRALAPIGAENKDALVGRIRNIVSEFVKKCQTVAIQKNPSEADAAYILELIELAQLSHSEAKTLVSPCIQAVVGIIPPTRDGTLMSVLKIFADYM